MFYRPDSQATTSTKGQRHLLSDAPTRVGDRRFLFHLRRLIMKTRLFTIVVFLVGLVLLMTLAFRGASVSAQRPQPTPAPKLPWFQEPFGSEGPDSPIRMPNGLWAAPRSSPAAVPPKGQSPQSTGGPDQYGYTWNNTVAFNWIDASTGTDTGMSGSSYGQRVGPVSLPFSFKFYENTYTSLYIAAAGFLSFANSSSWPDQQTPIPSPSLPNNIVAPGWTPTYLNSAGPTGRVYYTNGGVSPNRYFVVEWYDVKGGPPSDTTGGDDAYRFEAILYENGDIVFQYAAMSIGANGAYCGSAGIEDAYGLDGLAFSNGCWLDFAPNMAVRFCRPALSARLAMSQLKQGRFTHASATESFLLPIRNTGDLGADKYDLIPSSMWPISFYAEDGTTPLTDTNGLCGYGARGTGQHIYCGCQDYYPWWSCGGGSQCRRLLCNHRWTTPNKG